MDKKTLVKITQDTGVNCELVYKGEFHYVSEKDAVVLTRINKAAYATEEDKNKSVIKSVTNKDITKGESREVDMEKKLVKRGK